jgi:multidrug efflux system membrane fusion protein
VQTARVNLAFCRITSPINGRVGLRLVDPGNFVQTTNTTGLFVINTIDPITVIFVIPEDDIPRVMKPFKAGRKLPAQAYDRNLNKLLATGTLYAIDNQINPTTGTLNLRAQFANKDEKLFSNQFVNIKLLVETLKNATVVPTAAIQHGNQDYVYVYDDKSKIVHVTPIKEGVVSGDNTVILSGIKPGDEVITEGTDKLADKMKVHLAQTNPVSHPHSPTVTKK